MLLSGCQGRDMLRSHAHADDPRRNAPQPREAPDDTQHEGQAIAGLRRRSTRTTTVFWTAICARCVTRVGHSRRRCTAARSAFVSRRSRSGAANRLAAATASWIARLIPTPPIGDIACALSPMHSRPGRHQRSQPVDATVSSLTSSQSRSSRDAVAQKRRDRDDVARETRRGRAPAPRRTRPCGSRTRIASNRRGRASPACARR